MTTRSTLLAAAVLLSLSCIAGSAAEPGAPQAADLLKTLEEAQKQLGASDFDAREQARAQMLAAVEQFYLKVAAGLNSDNPEVRTGTESVLKDLEGRLRVARILARLQPEDQKALRVLLARDPDLLKQLSSNEAAERMKGVGRIAEAKDRLAVLALCELTNDDNEQVRKKAVKALGDVGLLEGLERLKTLALRPAGSGEAEVDSLRNMGHRFSIVGLPGAEIPEMRPVSRLAIQALGKLKHPAAARFLLSQLDNPTGGSVCDYLSALGQTGQAAAAVPKLMRFVEDERKAAELPGGQTLNIGGGLIMGRVVVNQVVRVNGQDVSAGDPSKITAGDVALSAVLALTQQKPSDYGMQDLPGGNMVTINGNEPLQGLETKCFGDEKARKEAVSRIKRWYETWPDKPKEE